MGDVCARQSEGVRDFLKSREEQARNPTLRRTMYFTTVCTLVHSCTMWGNVALLSKNEMACPGLVWNMHLMDVAHVALVPLVESYKSK